MTTPQGMSRACDVMQEEIEWFEGQDWSGISESERRGIFARHLAMYLDTAGFDLSNDVLSDVDVGVFDGAEAQFGRTTSDRGTP